MLDTPQTVTVILGPTASGKSGLALSLAERTNGVIINCDSMQVYDHVHAITARPSVVDCERVPHQLYGYLDVAEPNDVLAWRTRAYDAIYQAIEQGQTPYVVGGTGFYVRALTQGLSPIPDVPDDVRSHVRHQATTMTTDSIRKHVMTFDPRLAERFTDRQRLLRAWEVYDASGQNLSHWQAKPLGGVPKDLQFKNIALLPPRDGLYERCNRRFDSMMANGAMDEVAYLNDRLMQNTLPADSAILKACGVPELLSVIRGDTDLASAIAHAKTATRRYAKRQITWLRNQMTPDMMITKSVDSDLYDALFKKIQDFSPNLYK